MPKVSELPKWLKPYRFHGVNFKHQDGAENVYADCPFCAREKKFSIHVDSGQWRCLVCNEGNEGSGKVSKGGNVSSFLQKLYAIALELPQDLAELAESRGVSQETLAAWGVVESPLDGAVLVPAWNASGTLTQLYRYVYNKKELRWQLLCTPETSHGLLGVSLIQKGSDTVYLCEGPWDGMALWEVLHRATSPETVLAVPGCNVFNDSWAPLFSGKRVVLLYDSDHPRLRCVPCKKSWSSIDHEECPTCEGPLTPPLVRPAGYDGMQRVASVLLSQQKPPVGMEYLAWGPEGYDPELPNGYDLRDAIIQAATRDGPAMADERVDNLARLWERVTPVPAAWKSGPAGPGTRKHRPKPLEPKECTQWKTVVGALRKAMRWIEGLDRAMSVVLACVVSTDLPGDQLWIKVISPPATGKSTLAEAVSVSKKFIKALSTLRGMYSGFRADGEGKDNSLVTECIGKTLIIKDGDTLLTQPNKSQIMAELRDLYDRVGRTNYRNAMGDNYEGADMTVVLMGTSSLRDLDASELGERFVDVIIMEGIDENLEDEILWRQASRELEAVMVKSGDSAAAHHTPEMVDFMRLAGGYVEYLRQNAEELALEVKTSREALVQCVNAAKFVSYLRARPSKKQEEIVERELASRLLNQFTKLAKCLAIVMNKKTVDNEVMRRVRQCALDTARGRTLDIVRFLYAVGEEGMETKGVAYATGHTEAKERDLLYFLSRIGAVEYFDHRKYANLRGRPRWRLTERMRNLCDEVLPQTATPDVLRNGHEE
jgi:hypothetical protein